MRKNPPQPSSNRNTSWEPVEKWYNKVVGDDGHYYHQKIVIPGVLRLLNLEKKTTPINVLDIACGQGILARKIPANVSYTGLDLSTSLIKAAKADDKNQLHQYVVADVTKPFPIKNQAFTHAAIILALQNIEHPENVFNNLNPFLVDKGQVVIVLNHPCFRIPRQSSWQVDQEKKIQYRRIDRYASPMQIPIQAHPSKGTSSATTNSFHFSISAYSKMLENAGFVIKSIEEWCSDKVSEGGAAKMENRSREEFPMFMTIVTRKDVNRS
jgi:ubiquinone/menaquinone biosynthesis C-methylase UbiE